MLFNSKHFIIFFVVVTTLYFLIPHKLRWFLLLSASCIPLNGKWKELPKVDNRIFIPDPQKILYIQKCIDLCKERGVKLFNTMSPFYIYLPTDNITNTISAMNEYRFIDFRQNNFFLSRTELFKDPMHLNDKGAEIFTKKDCELFKRII